MMARARLKGLPEVFEQNPKMGAITVMRHGKPVLAVMPWKLYDSITETLEILSDEKVMKTLRKSLRQARKGRTHSMAEVKKRLSV